MPFKAGEVTSLPSPMFHALGYLHATIALTLGSTLVLHRKFKPATVLADIPEHNVTAIVVVPVMLSRMLDTLEKKGFLSDARAAQSLVHRRQGKLGAVEVKDMAVQMAKLASRATEFGGKSDDTIAALGAIAQEARAKGGAANASRVPNAPRSPVRRLSSSFAKSCMKPRSSLGPPRYVRVRSDVVPRAIS